MSSRILVVVGVFALLVGVLAAGLRLNPREVPSPLIGKPAPQFELPLLQQEGKTFAARQMLGKVWLLNVWASWCEPCLQEHPVITALARSLPAPVVGLNYKDARENALPWLARHGDPFVVSVFDSSGRIGIDYGVYGVPETYVIDKKGVIRYKRIGPVTQEIAAQKIEPLVKDLVRE
jgi:cytochrome c biogenesis protein CcmG, thiol:disulfide interchange protein DsbE